VAADITLVLEEARRRLDLSPIAAVALGRSLSAAALIQRISLKMPARVVLEVVGDGPMGKVVAEVDSKGHLRGLVGNPQLETPEDGRMRIAPLLGSGFLRVTREEKRSRYSSQVELVSGELGDDITHYLEQSEQIRSAVLLGVLPRPIGIGAAGGLIVEALPGTEDEVIDQLEENIRTLEGVSSCMDRGGIPALVKAVLQGFDREIVERQPLEYRCRCNR
jgi:molecular chaperone Hsp33